MTAINKKLARDLARMWAQGVTIALVVACGIASFVAMQTAYDSLLTARDRYYADRRFADVFAHLERAPEALAARLEETPGVARAVTRIVETVTLPLPDLSEPALARISSLPAAGEPPLNALHMREGRTPEPGRTEEVVVSEPFAQAHHYHPGDRIPAVINGTLRELTVCGVALSPEFVFAVSGLSFVQDDARFGILWMDRTALEAAFHMEASFNDVVFSLQPNANEIAVIDQVRRTLEPYGVVSVDSRERQLSNHVLAGELGQLRSFAMVLPLIFLTVAAVLVNIVLGRMLHLQRGQIATLKALGYRRGEIVLHYLVFAGVIVCSGAALGVLLGDLLGRGMLELYRPSFKFAALEYRLSPPIVTQAVLVSIGAATAGGLAAVLAAARLPPAEAMQPEAPPRYTPSLLERMGAFRWLSASSRMIARELLRRPLRTTLSCLGIALGTSVVGGARFAYDALDLFFELQFDGAQHEDFDVTFRRPVSKQAAHEIASIAGVVEAQPHRTVPVRVRVDHRYRDTALFGFADAAVPLRGVAMWPRQRLVLPEGGVVLSNTLAEILGVSVGGVVSLEVLEGARQKVAVNVTRVVPDIFGVPAYASLSTLERLLGEEGNVSSVLVRVDPVQEDRVIARLEQMPQVVAVGRRRELVRRFHDQTKHMWITTSVLTVFGAVIAFGVIYNHARVALSTRSRDLATLRVLGFTRREISSMLLAELATYVVVGLPVGLLLGRGIVELIMATADPESYRLPTYMSLATYEFSAAVTIGAALISALLVRRRLDHLDLIGVLKTRE